MMQPLLRSSFLKKTMILTAAGLLGTAAVRAQTVTIYRGGAMITPVYTSISDALAVALTGDSLALSAGHFDEHDIIINKKLIISGVRTLTDSTVLDPKGLGRGLYISDGDVTVRDLIIENGKLTNDLGGGIYVNGPATLTLAGRTIVRKNQVSGYFARGGGVGSYGRLILKDDASVSDNVAIELGGGIYTAGNIELTDRSSVRKNTTAGSGGGIFADKAGSLNIGGYAQISNNTAVDAGGGIYGTGRIHGYAVISNNTADMGGGIATLGDFLQLQDYATFSGNTAVIAGGAAWLSNTSFTATDHFSIINNRIPSASGLRLGGAIYNVNGNMNISGGRITGNQSPSAAIYNSGGALPMTVKLSQTHIYNPAYSGARQAELINRPSMASSTIEVNTDGCWWGKSDTTGIMANYGSTTVNLNSWVTTLWTLNNGAPVGPGTTSFPVAVKFALNDGSDLDTNTLRSLTASFGASAGTFNTSVAAIAITNDIAAIYSGPAAADSVWITAVADADSFRQKVYILPLLSIKDPGSLSAVNIYPNPATSWLQIEGLAPNTSVALYHIDGRMAWQQVISGGQAQVPVQALPAGNYLLQLQAADGSRASRQIVKQ
jgi:predicted outer membrane repeat protein